MMTSAKCEFYLKKILKANKTGQKSMFVFKTEEDVKQMQDYLRARGVTEKMAKAII
ncbi:hypothetical protein OYT40_002178 [Escherichia coli]|nr:hypothetical protein [Escherichia coli]